MQNVDATRGKITDEALAQLRSRLGKEYPIEEPFTRFINSDSIRHIVYSIGDPNPLWTDHDYARRRSFAAKVAPPSILYGASWGAYDMRRGHGLPGVHGLHCQDQWTWYRRLVEGDEIRVTRTLVGVDERDGKYAGRSIMQTREFRYYDADDQIVARCSMSSIRAEREKARGRGKYADVELGHYDAAYLARVDAALAEELPNGADAPDWDKVAVGDQLKPFVRGPLTVGDIVVWHMGAGGAAHIGTGRTWYEARTRAPMKVVIHPDNGVPHGVQEVHHDSRIAWIAAGMPAAYDIGAQRGAWSTVPLTNWLGDGGFLAALRVQYRGMNFLGDTTWWRYTVARKWRSRSGTRYVDFTFEAENQRGEVTLRGEATGALPAEGGVVGPRLDVAADRLDSPDATHRVDGGGVAA